MPRHITPPTAQELNHHSRLSSHHDTYSDAVLQSCVSDNRATPSVRDNQPGPDSEAARTARIAALSRLYGVIVRRMTPTKGGWQGGGPHVTGSRTHGAKAQCEAGDGAFRRQCPATNNTGATLGDDLSRDVGVRRTVSMSDACRRWVYRHRLGLDVLPSNTSAMGHRWSTGGEEDASWRGWWRGDGAEACDGVPHDRHPGRAQMLNEVTHDTASIGSKDQGVAQPTPGAGRIASSELLVLATNVECDTTRAMQAREAWTGPGRHVPTTHHSTHTCQPTTRSPFQRPRNNDDAVVDKILDQRTCACGPCVARHGCPATIRPTVACTVHGTTPVVGDGDFRRARSPSFDSIQVRDDDDDSVVTATTSRRQGVSAPTAPCRCSPPAMPYHGVLRRFAAVDTYSTQAHTYLVLASPGESNETRCSTASITDNTESRPTAPLHAAYCFGHDDDDDGSVTRHGKPTVPSVSSNSETGHGHDGQSGAPKSESALPHHVPHAPSGLRRDQYDARLHPSRQHDDCAGVVASAEANVGAMSSKASEQVYSPSPSLDQDGGVAQTLRGSTPSQVLHGYAAAERQHAVQLVQKDLGETRRKFEATCIVAGADTGVIETSGRPSSSDTAGGASSVELQAAFYRGQCSTVAVWQEQEWRQLSAAEQEEWDDLQRHILCGLEQVAREAIMSELTMAAHENAAQLVMLYVRRRTDLVAQAAQAHDKLLHEEQDAFIALRLSAATLRASAAMDEAERVRAGAAQALLEQRETLVHLFESLYARRVNDLLASEADMRAVLQVCALTDLWLGVRAAVCEEQQLARDELSYRVAIERREWLVPATSARVSPYSATVNHDVLPVIVAEETVSASPNTVEVATEILERTSSAQRISTEGMTPVVPPASISCGSARDQPISTAEPPLPLGVSAGETITVVAAGQSQEEKEGKSELPLAAGMQTGVEDVHRAVPSSEAEHDEGEAKEAEEDAEVEDEEDLTPTVFDNIVMKPHGPVSALIPQVKRRVRRDDRARHAARLVLIPPAEDEDSLFDQVDATWRHRETPSATLALSHRGHRPVPVDEPLRRVPPYRSRPKANWFEDSAA